MPPLILLLVTSSFFCSGRWLENPEEPICSPTSAPPCISRGAEQFALRAELPFELYAGYLVVVEGQVGPVRQLKFILDTGVTHSVVDRKVAQRLHLPLRSAQVLNVDKNAAIGQATVPYLRFGPVQVRDISMLVADLAQFSEFATHVDALIGMDLLRLNNLTIDNAAKKVLFDPLDRPAFEATIQSDPVCMTAEVLLQNHPVRLIVDTGLQGILLYEGRIQRRVHELMMENQTEIDVGRRLRAKQVSIQSVRLGSSEIDHPQIWLVKDPPETLPSDIDGFLGTSSLKARWIKFNFARNTLSWQ